MLLTVVMEMEAMAMGIIVVACPELALVELTYTGKHSYSDHHDIFYM